jgi:hypothetical protein
MHCECLEINDRNAETVEQCKIFSSKVYKSHWYATEHIRSFTTTPSTNPYHQPIDIMHFSKTFAISCAFSLALAANHIPVTIENLDPGFDLVCGGTTVAGRDVFNAVAWGMSLNENNEQLDGTHGTMTRS